MVLLPLAMFVVSFGLVLAACLQEEAGPLSAAGVLVGIGAVMALVWTTSLERGGDMRTEI